MSFRPDFFETLESAVDQFGFDSVRHMLAEIAAEKAEHLAANWQDFAAADDWNAAAAAINSADIPDSIG